jgi:hypothetical protein
MLPSPDYALTALGRWEKGLPGVGPLTEGAAGLFGAHRPLSPK